MNSQKTLTREQALSRLKNYCSYQERCHKEVREKLYSLGLQRPDVENIVTQLIEEDFLNEERFARQFAQGKCRMKGWGKTKIAYQLKQKQVSEYLVKKAMKEIEDDDYSSAIEKTAAKKWKTLKDGKLYIKKAKLYTYLLQKGFERQLVAKMVDKLAAEANEEC